MLKKKQEQKTYLISIDKSEYIMTTTTKIKPTLNHVTAFIEAHNEGMTNDYHTSDFFMNKALVEAVMDRVGGKEAFLVAHTVKMDETLNPSGISQPFTYDYSDEDNLKFWDDHREDILDSLGRITQSSGYDSAAEMVGYWFEDTPHCPARIANAFTAPKRSYAKSSAVRKEVCAWLSLAAITDAYVDFVCYMDGVEAAAAQ